MSRWIDYDAINYRHDKIYNKPEEFLNGVVYMAQRIEEAPSINIVRCGECKYCSKDRIKGSVKDEDGNWIDTKCNLCRHTKLEVSLDDFCSYGEVSETPTSSADTQTYITEDRDTRILDAWQVKQMQGGKE